MPVAVAIAGCDSPLEPDPWAFLPDVREYVTGEALAGLDANGHFLPVSQFPGSQPVLSRAEAERVALALVERIASGPTIDFDPAGLDLTSTKLALERDHGQPIDWRRLGISHRSPFGAYPYLEELPDSVPRSVHNYYGPHYFVPLFVGGRQMLTVAVAGYSGVWLDATGRLRGLTGNDMRPFALPYDADTGHPLAPELVVKAAVTALLCADTMPGASNRSDSVRTTRRAGPC